MKNYTHCILTVMSFIVVTSNLGAAIVTYQISDANSSVSSSISPIGSGNFSASTLTVNGVTASASLGLTPPPDQGYFFFDGWSTGGIDTSKYYSFTITPNSGFQIDFSTVAYTLSSEEASTYELRSSVDTFSSTLATHTLNPGVTRDQNTFADNLSLGVQTVPVTFRLYGYNSNLSEGLANNDFAFGGDPGGDLSIFGTVSAVPEPHEYAVVTGIGLLLFSIYRRGRLPAL